VIILKSWLSNNILFVQEKAAMLSLPEGQSREQLTLLFYIYSYQNTLNKKYGVSQKNTKKHGVSNTNCAF